MDGSSKECEGRQNDFTTYEFQIAYVKHSSEVLVTLRYSND